MKGSTNIQEDLKFYSKISRAINLKMLGLVKCAIVSYQFELVDVQQRF